MVRRVTNRIGLFLVFLFFVMMMQTSVLFFTLFEGLIIFFTILFCIPLWITHVPLFQPLPKSKKTPSKGGKKERSSTGTTRKTKRTKCPEILSDESSSEEDEKKEKDDSSEEKESEEEVMRALVVFVFFQHRAKTFSLQFVSVIAMGSHWLLIHWTCRVGEVIDVLLN